MIEFRRHREDSRFMTKSADALEKEALALPVRDRIEIAERLMSSVDDFAEAGLKLEWDREVEKRSEEIRQAQVSGVDSDAAFQEARRLLNE